ncbi:nucleotidyltransferase substrate binding protein, HI0074 family [Hathewaya proteolytica DSM 3090]|uniref:Nucleotidyltransferase substrate binding protein, HI0074 family n=1 Tax=Hathewaya proteolytica DSM 3090 TaxID=1121331 RepID=A0A1M6K5V2_9CLOT|nr:HI0074 family nucleotidyltransferase substrate-binding subunit [Hathewaya proteolytica]SHJ54356.1 nucleotidyltransferase substrate binding protein, HI0074 family [Hathewaya proteolytica DSM 3090]
MEDLNEIAWKNRFEDFTKTYKLLKKYSQQDIKNELERAGIVHFFEMTFELACMVLKDYLELEGCTVKSARETIKLSFQTGLIENGHVWIDALSNRNLTAHAYDDELAIKMTGDIVNIYIPEFDRMFDRLDKESEPYGLLERDTYYIQKALDNFPEIEKAVIFGSRAIGNYKKGSDVNIAVIGQRITEDVVRGLSNYLNEVYPLPYFFDAINYNDISSDMLKEHIDKEGEIIYIRKTNIQPFMNEEITV